MLLYSDGMVEQHGPDREMYGFPRLRERDGDATTPAAQLLDRLLDELHAFTGPGFGAGGRHHARHAPARRPAWPPATGAEDRAEVPS